VEIDRLKLSHSLNPFEAVHMVEHFWRWEVVDVLRCGRGDYLVAEDGCINGRPVRPDFGPGRWKPSRGANSDLRPGELLHQK